MAFTLSGTTITQTGVDADLSGLSAITGVTSRTLGTGFRARTEYLFDAGRFLQINGTLTHDTDKYLLTFSDNTLGIDNASKIVINGTYNYGIKANGLPSTLTGISIPADPNPWWNAAITNNTGASIAFTPNSTFNMYGGIISGAITFSLRGGGVINGGAFFVDDSGITNGTNWLPRILSSTIDIQKLEIKGGSLSIGTGTAGSTFAISRTGSGGVAYWPQHLSATPVRLKDYEVSADYDVGIAIYANANGNTSISENSAKGTAVDVRGGETDPGGYAQNAGIHTFVREIATNIVADDGAVQGKLYIKDTNNGQRKNLSGLNDIADNVYEADITNGAITSWTKTGGTSLTKIKDNEIILGIVNVVRAANPRGTSNVGVYRKDLRGKQDVEGTDEFDLAFSSYNHEIKTFERSLAGAEVFTLSEKVSLDASITEQNKATVDAYTTIDTAQQLYDRAKSYLVDNYAGETTTLVARSGNVLDAGDYNIVIDPSATSAFAFASNTLTIKSSGYASGLKTTGTITIKDGVDITGMYIDGDVLVEGEMKNITNVEVTGSLRFDSNVDKEIVIANSKLNILENLGTGQLSFENQNSTITDITDAEVILLEDVFTINLTNILAGSSVWIGDTSKDTLQYLVNQSGTYSFTSVRGYSNNLYYVVKKAGFSVFKGVITVDGTSTSTNISVTQTEVKDTDGTNMYGGGLTSANLTFTKLADKVTGSVTSDITAKVFYDEFQLFGESEDGCIWLSSNLDMQRITAGAGKQQIIYEKNINVNNGSLAGTYIIQSEVISQESPFDISLMGSVQSASSVGISASDIWDYLQTNTTIVGSMKEKIESSVKLVDIENSEILAKKAHLEVLNNNIKDSSILVPANRDLL